MLKQIRVGVIGCGGIAESAHIPNLLVAPYARLEAIADIDENRLLLTQRKFNFPKDKCYRDYRDVLSLRDLDAVVIATPAHTHGEMVLEAIRAGKHVFVEKPLSAKVDEVAAFLCRKVGFFVQGTFMIGLSNENK